MFCFPIGSVSSIYFPIIYHSNILQRHLLIILSFFFIDCNNVTFLWRRMCFRICRKNFSSRKFVLFCFTFFSFLFNFWCSSEFLSFLFIPEIFIFSKKNNNKNVLPKLTVISVSYPGLFLWNFLYKLIGLTEKGFTIL